MPLEPDPSDLHSWPYLKEYAGAYPTNFDTEWEWLIDTFMMSNRNYNGRIGCDDISRGGGYGTLFYGKIPNLLDRPNGLGISIAGPPATPLRFEPHAFPIYFSSGNWIYAPRGDLGSDNGAPGLVGDGSYFIPGTWPEHNRNIAMVFTERDTVGNGFSESGAAITNDRTREPDRVYFFDYIDKDNHHRIQVYFNQLAWSSLGVTYPDTGDQHCRIEFFKRVDGIDTMIGHHIQDTNFDFFSEVYTNLGVLVELRYLKKNRWQIRVIVSQDGLEDDFVTPETIDNGKYWLWDFTRNGLVAHCNTTLLGGRWMGAGCINAPGDPKVVAPASVLVMACAMRLDDDGVPLILPSYANPMHFGMPISYRFGEPVQPVIGETSATLYAKYESIISNYENNGSSANSPGYWQATPYAQPPEFYRSVGKECDGASHATMPDEIMLEFSGIANTSLSMPPHGFCTDCTAMNGLTLFAKRNHTDDGSTTENPEGAYAGPAAYTFWEGIDDTLLPCQGFLHLDNSPIFVHYGHLIGISVFVQGSSLIRSYPDGGPLTDNAGRLRFRFIVSRTTSATSPIDGTVQTSLDAIYTYHEANASFSSEAITDPDPHFPLETYLQKMHDKGYSAYLGTVPNSGMNMFRTKDTDSGVSKQGFTDTYNEAKLCNFTNMRILVTPVHGFEVSEPEAMPDVASPLPSDPVL